MLNFIKKIFSSSEKLNDEPSEVEMKIFNEDKTRKIVFEEEFSKTNIFKQNSKDLIFKHIKNETDLNKSENLISKEEKEKLGLNKNLKITRELLDIFNLDKLNGENPKDLLSNFSLRIFHKIMKIRDLPKISVKPLFSNMGI